MNKNIAIRKKWSDILTVTASLGLGVTTVPQLIKAIRDPKSVKDLSPSYLFGRPLFFIVLATGLFLLPSQYKVFNTRVISWLSVWYIFFYVTLIIARAVGKKS